MSAALGRPEQARTAARQSEGTLMSAAGVWGMPARSAPLCHTLTMRLVGHSKIPDPQLTPSAAALGAARIHQTTGRALAAVPTTGIRHGIYRFASHEVMNRATDDALIDAICMNLQARNAAAATEND